MIIEILLLASDSRMFTKEYYRLPKSDSKRLRILIRLKNSFGTT